MTPFHRLRLASAGLDFQDPCCCSSLLDEHLGCEQDI